MATRMRTNPDGNPDHGGYGGGHLGSHHTSPNPPPPNFAPSCWTDSPYARSEVSKGLSGSNQLFVDAAEQPSGNENNDDVLVLIVGGAAVANGENTLTTGEVHTDAKDLGRVTRATGEATFIAAAESPQSGDAYADTDTFAEASGADFVFIRTIESGPDYGADGTALSTSTIKVVAIDIEGIDFAGGPIVIGSTLTMPSRAHYEHFALSGHVAAVTVDAEAFGDNTLASTDTFALTDADGDNPFSVVSGLALAGVA